MRFDIWDKQQLLATRNDYLKPRTMSEFIDWVKQSDHFGLVNESSSQWPVNYKDHNDHPLATDRYTFAKIADIKSIDLSSVTHRLLDDLKDVTVVNSSMRPDLVDSKEKRLYAEYGFDRETDTKKITYQNYPEVWQLGELFDLEKYSVATQYQPSGCMLPRHVDFLDSMWLQFADAEYDFMDLPFNTLTKCPEGYYALRMMIALTPWSPGHVFGFEDTYWKDWQPGEVITFDWAHVRHYTANLSFNPRLFIKVSGITQNKNHWIFDAINNGTVKQI